MSPRAAAVASPADPVVPWKNAVVLCGRLTAGPEPVELPSGDPLWRFRVAVERAPVRPPARRPGTDITRRVVDSLDCSTSSARLAARLEKAPIGSVVEVAGILTRRFWRSAGGPASRYEVVVDHASVVRKAAVERTDSSA